MDHMALLVCQPRIKSLKTKVNISAPQIKILSWLNLHVHIPALYPGTLSQLNIRSAEELKIQDRTYSILNRAPSMRPWRWMREGSRLRSWAKRKNFKKMEEHTISLLLEPKGSWEKRQSSLNTKYFHDWKGYLWMGIQQNTNPLMYERTRLPNQWEIHSSLLVPRD